MSTKSNTDLKIKIIPPYKKHLLKWLRRLAFISVEVVTIIFVICLLCIVGLMVRIHVAPLPLGFAKALIEPYEKAYNFDADEVYLSWPAFDKPIILLTNAFIYKNESTGITMNIPSIGVGISPQTITRKKLIISSVFLDRPDISYTPANETEKKSIDFSPSDFIRTVIDENAALANLKTIEIRDGEIRTEQATFDAVNTIILRMGDTIRFNASLNGNLIIPDYYPDGLPLYNTTIAANYSQASETLSLAAGFELTKTLHIKTNAQVNFKNLQTAKIAIEIPNATHDDVSAAFPLNKRDAASYRWLVTKMTGYTLNDITIEMNCVFGSDATTCQNLSMNGAYENADINYNAPMIPVKNASGTVTYDDDDQTLHVITNAASANDMTINASSVKLYDLKNPDSARAEINVALQGSLASAFDFLSRKPINIAPPVPINTIKGQGTYNVTLKRPLFKDVGVNDIDVTANATMTNITFPNLVAGTTLSAPSLTATLKNNVLSINGKGTVDAIPMDFTFKQDTRKNPKPFKRKITASLDTSQQLRQKFGANIEYITGVIPAKITHTEYADNTAKVDVTGDLNRAIVNIPPLSYTKPAGTKGSIKASTALNNKTIQMLDIAEISMPSLTARNGNIIFKNGQIDTGTIETINLRDQIMQVTFNKNLNGADHIKIKADQFDLQPFQNNNDDDNKTTLEKPLHIFIDTPSLQTSEGQFLKQAKLFTVMQPSGGFQQLELDGKAGNGMVYIRYKPNENGQKTFKMQANDAGAALQLFDTYTHMNGGILTVDAIEDAKGIMAGKLIIKDFKLVKATIFAKLLGAMSLNGLTGLVNNDGLAFDRLQTKFQWHYIKQGRKITFQQGHTVGNALGITFDGEINTATNNIDMNGTIIPVSGLNKIVSDIPVIGTILSGGSNSVFAATYTMKGIITAPRVVVNPLAALTPGLLRQFLFEE